MSAAEPPSLSQLLQEMERKLMDPAFRRDRAEVAALLAEEFVEIGSSGRIWSKEATLALLAKEAYDAPVVAEFLLREIAPGVALATYRTLRQDIHSGAAESVLRSSLWIYRDGRWQIVWHQGTKVP